MNKITPFFTVNGVRYEIKRTRFILAEYDKLIREIGNTADENAVLTRYYSLVGDIEKYAKKTLELEQVFFDTFEEEAERRYLKCKSLYDNALRELSELEATGNISQIQKRNIDFLENIAIISLAENYFDLDFEKAKELWETFVGEKGNDFVVTWLLEMKQSVFTSDDEVEQDDFLSQVRKRKEEQERNRRAGAKK